MKHGNATSVREQLLRLVEEAKANGEGRLPAERELAATTGASRVTVGKIISQLTGEGILVRRRGSGTYIVGADKSTRRLSIGVGARTASIQDDSHFTSILCGISNAAERLDASLQIFDRLAEHFSRLPADNRVTAAIDAKLLDGFLIISRMPLGVVEQIKRCVPLVIVNNILNDGEQVCVSCDYVEVGHLAAKYLIRRGHTHVAYVNDDLDHPERWANECGIRLAMESAGLTFPPERSVCIGKNYDYMKRYLGEFVAAHPDVTALIARNDVLAWRMIHILEELGKRVPDDISVIGVGNYENMGKPSFKLTTIDNRLAEMAGQGLELLIGMMKGNPPKEKIYLLRPRFVERDTVCDRKS